MNFNAKHGIVASNMTSLIGRTGRATVSASGGGKNTLDVDVTILDVREAYGRIDVYVRPIAGTGEAWMAAYNVTLDEPLDSPESDIDELQRRS